MFSQSVGQWVLGDEPRGKKKCAILHLTKKNDYLEISVTQSGEPEFKRKGSFFIIITQSLLITRLLSVLSVITDISSHHHHHIIIKVGAVLVIPA